MNTSLQVRARARGAAMHVAPAHCPRVDVVIPNYNYARYLPQAIASVLSQESVDVRAIVVDDASSDDSVAVVREIARTDDRVTVVEHRENRGPVATFNDGLDLTDAEYIVRLDADDLLTPGSLARSTWLADRFPNVGLVYGHPLHFAADLPQARQSITGFTVWTGGSWLELRCRLGVNCITSPEVLMRASVVSQIGGQRDLAHTHDMEMWFRIARHSDVGHLSGCDQAWHREHDASLSARSVDVMTDLQERADAFRVLFEESDDADSRRLWQLARTALAEEAGTRAVSAFLRGRGGTPETDGYLRFASEQGIDPAAAPGLMHAQRALSGRAFLGRANPRLIGHSARFRLDRVILGNRWKATGL